MSMIMNYYKKSKGLSVFSVIVLVSAIAIIFDPFASEPEPADAVSDWATRELTAYLKKV